MNWLAYLTADNGMSIACFGQGADGGNHGKPADQCRAAENQKRWWCFRHLGPT